MYKRKISLKSDKSFRPFGNYSHGILNQGTGLLVTSGQLGIKLDGSIPSSFTQQTEVCFSNILSLIEEVNFIKDDILRVTAFVTNRENFPNYMKVRDRFFDDVEIKPASTLLVVSGFTKPEFLVEIEVIAQK